MKLTKFFASYLIALSLLILSINAATEVYEITKIKIVKEKAEQLKTKYNLKPKELLIAFDIDNTLGKSEDIAGSDQCFNEITKQYDRKSAISIYAYAQNHTNLLPVEIDSMNGSSATVKQLQKAGYTVIGLTSRGFEVQKHTFKQLKKIGINFTKKCPSKESFNFDTAKYDCRYKKGILFCASNDKGEMLQTLLNKIGYNPKAVIVIDDKQHNLDVVAKSFKQEMPLVALRYGACDEEVKSFDIKKYLPDIKKRFAEFLRPIASS